MRTLIFSTDHEADMMQCLLGGKIFRPNDRTEGSGILLDYLNNDENAIAIVLGDPLRMGWSIYFPTHVMFSKYYSTNPRLREQAIGRVGRTTLLPDEQEHYLIKVLDTWEEYHKLSETEKVRYSVIIVDGNFVKNRGSRVSVEILRAVSALTRKPVVTGSQTPPISSDQPVGSFVCSLESTTKTIENEIERVKTWLNTEGFHIGTAVNLIARRYRSDLKKLYADIRESIGSTVDK